MSHARKPDAVPVYMGAAPGQGWYVTPDTVDMTRPAPPVRRLAITAKPQNIVVDAAKSALLIVDMQNDFCTKGGWIDAKGIDVSPNRKPIEPLRRMIEAFRVNDMPVVWVNWGVRKDLLNMSPSLRHAHSPDGSGPGLGEAVPGSRSEVLRAGSWGAAVVDEINPGDKGCEFPRLRHHPGGGRDGHDLAGLLRAGGALQCEASVRLRGALRRRVVGAGHIAEVTFCG